MSKLKKALTVFLSILSIFVFRINSPDVNTENNLRRMDYQITDVVALDNPEKILDAIVGVKKEIDSQGEYDASNPTIRNVLDNMFVYFSDLNCNSELPEDYFRNYFDELLFDVIENKIATQSEGVTSIELHYTKQKFLWFYVYMPTGFTIRLSADACRDILSTASDIAFDLVVRAFESAKLGPVIAATLSLLAGVTGSPILVAAVGTIAFLAAHPLISFFVTKLLSQPFYALFDYIWSNCIKDGIYITTNGTSLIDIGLQQNENH